jgi:GNAT superfamily N-acetyltransferase
MAYAGGERKSEPAFWKWHYLENPNARADDIPLWVVVCDDEIVGQLATIPVQLKVGKATRPAIWILDFIVREDFRGKGLGKKLVLAAQEKYPTMITLGINEQSAGLFRSQGWAEMGTIHRYHRMLYAGNGLKHATKIAPLREALNLLSVGFRSGVPRGQNKFSAKHLTEFGTEFDDFWERASAQWPCAVRRDARTLAWQFERQPGKKFDIIGLYENDRLAGYAVLFFRKAIANTAPAKAAISDLCYETRNSAEVVDALIGLALRRAVERRAASLVTDVLDGLVEERLKRHGFWRVKKSPQFMVCAAEGRDELYKPQNWFLTRADSDVSIIEEPNLD